MVTTAKYVHKDHEMLKNCHEFLNMYIHCTHVGLNVFLSKELS